MLIVCVCMLFSLFVCASVRVCVSVRCVRVSSFVAILVWPENGNNRLTMNALELRSIFYSFFSILLSTSHSFQFTCDELHYVIDLCGHRFSSFLPTLSISTVIVTFITAFIGVNYGHFEFSAEWKYNFMAIDIVLPFYQIKEKNSLEETTLINC